MARRYSASSMMFDGTSVNLRFFLSRWSPMLAQARIPGISSRSLAVKAHDVPPRAVECGRGCGNVRPCSRGSTRRTMSRGTNGRCRHRREVRHSNSTLRRSASQGVCGQSLKPPRFMRTSVSMVLLVMADGATSSELRQ